MVIAMQPVVFAHSCLQFGMDMLAAMDPVPIPFRRQEGAVSIHSGALPGGMHEEGGDGGGGGGGGRAMPPWTVMQLWMIAEE